MVHLEIKDNTNDKITGNFRYEYFPCLKAINGVLILLYFFFLFGVNNLNHIHHIRTGRSLSLPHFSVHIMETLF